MEAIKQDLSFGLRLLLKSPGFTAIAVLSLALGIGANTAIFSLVDAVLLRPLPFHEPDRLAVVWENAAWIGFPQNTPAPANYADWKAQNQVFEDMAAISFRSYNLTGTGEPEKLDAQATTANLFPLLGVKPALGRTFLPDEDQPEANKVALISHGLWQRRFGGDDQIVGRDILLNGQKFTVVGVMPASFQLLGRDVNLWTPIAFTPRELSDRGSHYLTVFARMKAGVTSDQAQADIDRVMAQIHQANPEQPKQLQALVMPLREQLAGDVRPALLVLLVAVGCVLLIACANIANLLLARAATRRREIAVRTALGAGRWRIVRQLLTESILLAGAGGLVGLLVAHWSFAFLKQLIPPSMSLLTNVQLDRQILAYTVGLSLLTGLIFGLAPALQAAKVDLNEALKQSAGRVGLSAGHSRLRNILVVAEVALALVLLVGAGLLIQTFVGLRRLDPGFRPENVLTVRTALPRPKYRDLAQRTAFYRAVLERVKALPGVTAAGFTTGLPLLWKGGTSGFLVEGKTPEMNQDATHRQITPDYFQAMGMQLKQGRTFTEHDGPDSQAVVVINETMARQFWPNENPLGKRMKMGGLDSTQPWREVVGVVGDVKQMGLEVPTKAEMFFSYQQVPEAPFFAPRDLAIRASVDPTSLVPAIREAIWAVDKDQPISNIQLLDEILADEVSQQRLGMTLLSAFAALALLLASLGIYGVLSYSVTQRTQEIGVRLALGAQRRDVLQIIVGDGMRLALIGMGLGLAAAFAVTRVMASLLFKVSATDPLTFIVVPMLLLVVSLLASYLPARRATRVDPMIALRYE